MTWRISTEHLTMQSSRQQLHPSPDHGMDDLILLVKLWEEGHRWSATAVSGWAAACRRYFRGSRNGSDEVIVC
jgi:hypothetical protein